MSVPWVTKKCKLILKGGKKKMLNILILQNILVLGAFSSLRTIGKTSFNVGTCCNANCRRIHQVGLQITWYPAIQQYPGVPHVASCTYFCHCFKNKIITCYCYFSTISSYISALPMRKGKILNCSLLWNVRYVSLSDYFISHNMLRS